MPEYIQSADELDPKDKDSFLACQEINKQLCDALEKYGFKFTLSSAMYFVGMQAVQNLNLRENIKRMLTVLIEEIDSLDMQFSSEKGAH